MNMPSLRRKRLPPSLIGAAAILSAMSPLAADAATVTHGGQCSYEADDACTDCRTLHLVETKLDGTQRRFAVFDAADRNRIGADRAARKAHVLARLWKLAKKKWPTDKLQQGYTVTTGKPPAGDPDGDPPFVAEVTMKGGARIRYDLGAKTSMCWCEYTWKAEAKRAP